MVVYRITGPHISISVDRCRRLLPSLDHFPVEMGAPFACSARHWLYEHQGIDRLSLWQKGEQRKARRRFTRNDLERFMVR